MGFVDEMQKRMDESKAQWLSIDEVSKRLTVRLGEELTKCETAGVEPNETLLDTAALLLLLVEQLRPLASSEGQMEDVQKVFANVLEGLGNTK